MSRPRVSVVMPMRNAAAHLRSALDSVWQQTFADVEVIALNDGSSDDTAAILRSMTDERLRVIDLPPSGIVAACNRGIDEARGDYVARMDADDLMTPDRLRAQVAELDARPRLVALGTAYDLFGDATGTIRPPRSPRACRAHLLFGSPLAHPAAMIRTTTLRRHHIRYRAAYTLAEDYRLFSELARVGELGNLDLVGLRYRIHPHQSSSSKAHDQRTVATRISTENLAAAGVPYDPVSLRALLWPPERGAAAAATYAAQDLPRLLGLGARAAGAAGLSQALLAARERLRWIAFGPAI